MLKISLGKEKQRKTDEINDPKQMAVSNYSKTPSEEKCLPQSGLKCGEWSIKGLHELEEQAVYLKHILPSHYRR